MRLTFDIIGSAEQYMNPCKQRVIHLGGLKIAAIENIGATRDIFDVIDLSNNELIKLDNFPPLKKLETLMVANNRIAKIEYDLLINLSSLKSLVLTSNRLLTLRDILPLTKGSSLERLSLINNPVTSQTNYKEFLIYHIPSLRFLDFEKIRLIDKVNAKRIFESDEGLAFLNDISNPTLDKGYNEEFTVKINTLNERISKNTLKKDKIESIQNKIKTATDLSEIQRLEKALETGVIEDDLIL